MVNDIANPDIREKPRPINAFPNEVLELVLAQVKRNACIDGDSTFVNALVTRCRWRDVGEKLLWTDVSVTTQSLAKFCSSTSTMIATVRTFTLTVHLRDMRAGERYEIVKHSENSSRVSPDWNRPSSVTSEFWAVLEMLPSAIVKMDQLESFSFVVTGTGGIGFRIRSNDINAILEALPPTLRHLEIDTQCYWDRSDPPSHHICHSISRLLPNLHNLRLEVGRLCDRIFQCENSSTLGPGKQGSLIINTVGTAIKAHQHWTSTLHCKSLLCSLAAGSRNEWIDSKEFIRGLVSAAAAAGIDGKLFGFECCSIISQAHRIPTLPGSPLHTDFNTIFDSRVLPSLRQN